VNLLRIDHTAIVVRDLDEAMERYGRLYGLHRAERGKVPLQPVEAAVLPIGDTRLELIQPTDTKSGVARFLEKRGEALHHIGIQVQDIRRELQQLADEGVELIDREPRRGLEGLVAFVHPKASGGVLIELVEKIGDELIQG
jgi:methylmalonyl-CoA epimerase